MNLPADDRGFALGDGLFETVLALDGRLIRWGEHMARLRRGWPWLEEPGRLQSMGSLRVGHD